MKSTLKPGDKAQFSYQVPASKTVPHLYPEAVEFAMMPKVFATGFMVGLMEWTCMKVLMKFDVRFYLVSILFIVFDLETALLFPWALSMKHIGDLGFWAMIVFIVELALGLAYVWRKGALEWD